jgi:K+-transporting ATPase ATPase B chain
MTQITLDPREGGGASPLAGGLSGAMIGRAVGDAFVKLNPVKLVKNPVIFTTWIVALLSTISAAAAMAGGQSAGFAVQLALWLWATVLFANVAESVAEGRGKAAADSLRATRVTTKAKLIVDPETGTVIPTNASDLEIGSVILVEAGDVIASDGEIIEGVASVNEAAITGESAPVIRESGGDRSAVTGGTTVVSDWIKVRITATRKP